MNKINNVNEKALLQARFSRTFTAMTMSALGKKICAFTDYILSPPPNYVKFTYKDRLRRHFKELKTLKNPASDLVHTLRLSIMLGLSWLLWPLAKRLEKNGYRFVDIDLNQIGSVLFLDLYLRDDAVRFQTPREKILVLASSHKDANRYLLDLYNDHVTFVRNPFLKFLLSPFFMSDVFAGCSFQFDTVYYTKAKSHIIFQAYEDKYHHPLISFPSHDMPKAQELLTRYVPAGQKFVALHVRDSGFYGDKDRTTRNADINRYKKSIQHLIAQGYAVVRMGDKSAVDIEKLMQDCGPMLFDYAHSDIRSPMMDCYLMSQCEFFFGTPSGPYALPMLFGVSSINTNWNNIINAVSFLPGDVVAFKKPRYKKDDSLVPFAQLLQAPLSLSPNIKALEADGLYLEENSEDEIFETLMEFLNNRTASRSARQQQAQDMFKETDYGFKAPGKLADSILKNYF